jgi:hypothetical protein
VTIASGDAAISERRERHWQNGGATSNASGTRLRRGPAISRGALPPRPKLIDFFSPHASLDKVKNEVRDLCTLLFTYFRPSLDGDFEWVATYRAHRAL